jgi:colanic acid biosynthesis glycosyl transferase WcaI
MTITNPVPRLIFISELYYPEDTSTGFFVTGIAEGLAEALPAGAVSVLCAQPSYVKKGMACPEREQRRGVLIHRLAAPKGDKNRLAGRMWNAFSLTIRFAWTLWGHIRRDMVVVTVTNPPSIPWIATAICRLKKARSVLLVHDVYPDVLVPAGLSHEKAWVYRLIDTFQCWMLRRQSAVVVLGRDMRSRLEKKRRPGLEIPFCIIPNWGDEVAVRPEQREANPLRQRLGLESTFLIQFSGNLGRTHGLEDVLALATHFQTDPNVHFLVFGWGAGKAWMESEIQRRGLTHLTLLPPCPMDELGVHLTACDLFLLPFKPGMEGISVPSRLYNVLAAGSPVLAIASGESELGRVVSGEQIGWVVEPGNLEAQVAAILDAQARPEALRQMGDRARKALLKNYTREHVVNLWRELLLPLMGVDGKDAAT